MKYLFAILCTLLLFSCQKDDAVMLAEDSSNLLTTETDKLILDNIKIEENGFSIKLEYNQIEGLVALQAINDYDSVLEHLEDRVENFSSGKSNKKSAQYFARASVSKGPFVMRVGSSPVRAHSTSVGCWSPGASRAWGACGTSSSSSYSWTKTASAFSSSSCQTYIKPRDPKCH